MKDRLFTIEDPFILFGFLEKFNTLGQLITSHIFVIFTFWGLGKIEVHIFIN